APAEALSEPAVGGSAAACGGGASDRWGAERAVGGRADGESGLGERGGGHGALEGASCGGSDDHYGDARSALCESCGADGASLRWSGREGRGVGDGGGAGGERVPADALRGGRRRGESAGEGGRGDVARAPSAPARPQPQPRASGLPSRPAGRSAAPDQNRATDASSAP